MFPLYDVIVVGAGHAGCEAAAAAANMGSKVLLITMNMQTIAQMSCNPAMGGIAKGQIVREIDALGGYSGLVTDKTMIQFRMLNRSKGPAMWSPRAQSDRMQFSAEWRSMLEQTPNVEFWQDSVTGLLIKNGRITGVKTGMDQEIQSKTVVLTNGTFLNGLIHVGTKNFGGGRMGEKAATGITEQLVTLGFESGRMKTGTPPRVDGRSIDFTRLEIQEGDPDPVGFSYLAKPKLPIQRPCHIAYTNQVVHDLLRTGFEDSPMYSGRIQARGPRYCPSIEDKIDRFADKDRHQLFVEPEGWNTIEYYINGFSTSLPEEVQFKALRSVEGFEQVRFFRPGYAIEYDYFPPTQLKHTLETKIIQGLYFAGQINGTTGYEEAACQGLMAGINAHLQTREKEPFILQRNDAYIGVLIDDLINKGTEEPYRMFTSRAEFRLLLRQDNADIRLTPKSHALGLASFERMKLVSQKIQEAQKIDRYVHENSVEPDEINSLLLKLDTAPIRQKVRLNTLLLRPQLSINALMDALPAMAEQLSGYTQDVLEQAEINLKYAGYLEKEQELVDKMQRLEKITLSQSFDFQSIISLSHEAKEKLTKIRPSTLGQASRISGVSPSDLSVLLVYLGR
ncbi:MAG: tRNA uridine-5-carboxymethylaminomethyl(34) synthesis enzyme MnmG [Bacteroidetes bacterium]|nr:tRNA uridine-5-carboxymethylaminomethyl(34) synthesis enzyme MnmG [Bacteroidota bacterium]